MAGTKNILINKYSPLRLIQICLSVLFVCVLAYSCAIETFTCEEISSEITVVSDESAALISITSANEFLRMKIEYGPKGFQQGEGTVLNDFGIVSPSSTEPNVFTSLVPELSPDTEYDVFVTASCIEGEGVTVLGPQEFTTISFGQGCTSPSQFTLGQVSSSGANISWNANNQMQWEVSWYEILSDTTDVLVDVRVSEAAQFEITSLRSGTSYRTTVRAICGEGNFEFSDFPMPKFIEFTTLR